MAQPRTWTAGAPEPYPWPRVRDRDKNLWFSCQAGWHVELPDRGTHSCVDWKILTNRYGPLTEEPSAQDRDA
jgi:hypothetical protein